MSFIAANIIPNDFLFNPGDSLEELLDRIQPLCNFTEIETDETMDFVVHTINLHPEDFGDTSLCYETSRRIFQLCHKSVDDNADNSKLELNGLASYLVQSRTKIYGPVVVLASRIDHETNVCSPCDITINDILHILNTRIQHKGIYLGCDGYVDEFLFTDDPLWELSEEEKSNLQQVECPFLKFNLVILIKVKPTNNTINGKATRLLGTSRIYDDVIIVHRSSEYDYLDLTKPTFEKLLTLAYGGLHNRELTEAEKGDGKKHNDLPLVINRYCVVEKRYARHLFKCHGCSQTLTTFVVCGGCYRRHYHDEKCQQGDWEFHKDDCLLGKESLNDRIKVKQESEQKKSEPTV